MSFYEQLVAATEPQRQQLYTVPQIGAALAGRISRATYVAYLAQAYHHVKHTVPLMQAALMRLGPDKPLLRKALQDYIAEETGHEAWILDDIWAAGGDAEAVRLSEPAPATRAMVETAYDFIESVNPAGFFGMVFVLEGTSVALASQGATAVQKSLGLGDDCFSYLNSHGALDVDHIAFFRDLMNRIDDADDQAAIIALAQRMFGLFADMFRAIPLLDDATPPASHPQESRHVA